MTTPTPMLEAGEPGLPDIAWLTRLANEMFRSQPGSPWPSDPTPTTPLGGFGATTPSAPMPPGSVAEVPQPTAAAVSVPTPGTAIPGETELRGPLGASPPIAASGFGLTSSSSPLPSVPTPTTPLGGFGATTPSAPMPPGSVAEVPQPTPAAVRVPTPGTAIPGETELRGPLGASPPIAAGGFGLTSSSSPLPSVPTPTTPLGGFGATTPSAPMPPGSVAEVPQPTAAAVSVPPPGMAVPGETELRGLVGSWPPNAAGGLGLTPSFSPLPSVPTPTTPLGGFGATTPSTPMPPGSAAEVPQPTAAAVSVPPLGMAIPGETELRGLLGSWPPNAAGGLGLTPSSSPLPSVPTPTTPLGGFGATTPSAPMPPGSAAEVPQPTAAAVSMPTPGTAIPGETELRGLLGASPPIAVGGFGWTSPFDPTPLPDLARLDMFNPGEDALRALLGGIPASPAPAAAQPPDTPGATAPSFYYFLEELGQGVPTTTAASPAAPASPAYDVDARRADFPILSERVNGRPLIWLDNGATTQKPRSVIDRLVYFYEHENSNVRRAAHELAARATDAYEGARETVRRFVHAGSADEIVFVRGTTEAINLVAQSWGRQYIGAGDEIVITWLEHHANIVPWQMLCAQTGAKLRVAPVDDDGQVILEEYGRLLGPRTKLVAFTQVSNALGIITPSAVMTAMAHAVGARVLLDGAQSVSHMRTDVQAIGCDWFVFSGHKIFAPTGIGALYGRTDVLEESPPWQGGGSMIKDVTFEHTEYEKPPARFEAGTGNIADAVGLGTALDYVEQVGLEAISAHEDELLVHATHLLNQIPGLRLLGTAPEKAAVISFVIDGINTETIGTELNRDGIAVRAGHHCAQPILRRFGVESSVRASLALYNTHADVEALATSLRRIRSGTVI